MLEWMTRSLRPSSRKLILVAYVKLASPLPTGCYGTASRRAGAKSVSPSWLLDQL
jgi:hypothetical protein